MSRRVVPFIFAAIIATWSFVGSTDPFPYNLYSGLLVISYPIVMELIIYALPRKRIIRLIGVWFLSIVPPPVWAANGIVLLYGARPPITSSDVLLPMLWAIVTILFYVYAIAVSLMETFPRS